VVNCQHEKEWGPWRCWTGWVKIQDEKGSLTNKIDHIGLRIIALKRELG
jgi:hypothetical protein